jgi:hypothetical protein
MCLPTVQECVEDGCERVAMSGERVCFGHATVEQMVG